MTVLNSGAGHANFASVLFFVVFLLSTLVITWWAARRTKTAEQFFAAGRSIGPMQNGVALAGDFVAAAGFLGISGLVSLVGFDGLIYAIGGIIGWPIMLFLFGEPLRNLGKYSFGDVLAYRLNSPNIRIVTGITTLGITVCYLVMQMVGAGELVHLLFGMEYEVAIWIIGAFMLVYVIFGGMLATTWVQIIKAALMSLAAIVMTYMSLAHFGFNPVNLLAAASAAHGPAVLSPGKLISNPVDGISVSLALSLGVASLPHVLMRFFTVADGRAARKSLVVATTIISIFLMLTFILGFAAMQLVGQSAIAAMDKGGNMAIPLLAEKLGGVSFLGFVSAVSFATILAVVSGLLITGATTVSHDLFDAVIKRGKATQRQTMFVARVATVALTVIAIILGLILRGQNVAFLVGLATAVAAGANFPAIFLAIYWKRYTVTGAVWGMMVGLISSLLFIYFSPTIQVDVLKHHSALLPLRNPAIFCVPLSFAVSIVASLLSRRVQDPARYQEIEQRILLGAQGL
ncbi:cation acetate symporter [Paraburkholderia phytofirmans OLGA172]|uniref:Cation acetate symporter n=1 Tax=Paraburkholderia phytofirmans OLGA172 TaxID=1417228 RepID=A0A167W8Z1_9BURK|nr:sodium/solute symporter [Paraburkholderia phytofirmans]ANB74973.1 cation acetate symporter [Paraburkholderia phytofirmans OLGA172]